MKKITNNISIISIIYLTIPLICFYFGWLKLPIAIISSIITIFSSYKIYKSLNKNEIKTNKKKQIIFWLTAIILIILWVYLSSIGEFSYQRKDSYVRVPLFHDLINYKWPLKYNISNNDIAFIYYLSWWLPICVISKIFNLSMNISNLLLLIYSIIGILLIVYEMNCYLKKNSYIGLILLILFSGLDILSLSFKNTELIKIEWWTNLFQYTSNTSLLYYCFNQAIPIWLISILILRLKDNKSIFALFSLVFVYSPWSIYGLIPISIYIIIKNIKNIKELITIENIIQPLLILIIYGSYYLTNNGNVHYNIIFKPIIYLVFILIEVGIYFIIIHHKHKDYPYYYPVLIMLLLAPIIYSYPHGNNFTMRSTTIPLFFLMIYIILFLENKKIKLKLKLLLIFFLVIGSIVPILEFSNSFTKPIKYKQTNSFNNLNNINKKQIKTIKDQFFAYNYKNKFFFKYLSK